MSEKKPSIWRRLLKTVLKIVLLRFMRKLEKENAQGLNIERLDAQGNPIPPPGANKYWRDG